MFIRQESFVYFPEKGLSATPQALGLPYQDLRLQTADAVSLGAWWVPAGEPRGAVILAHGNAGNISHRLDKVELFHALGLSVLCFDYRGYGESQGLPSEEGTYRDMDAAVAFATERLGISLARTVYFGESLGGAVAVEAASRRQPGALVCESTFTSLPAMARRHYPWLPARLLLRLRYDSLSRIPSVRCPVLILHGPEDDIVPFDMAVSLLGAAREPKSFAKLEGGHNDGGITASPAAQAALRLLMDQVLGPAGGGADSAAPAPQR
jgi:uncharacterized protein